MPPLKIAIIGAGPAGCMLARLLLQSLSPSEIKITIFESEPTPDYRSQGGTLDLHPLTGLKAMKKSGLHEEFLKYARYHSATTKMVDKNMKTFFKIPESKSVGSPEIDRAQLRQLLVESLPKEIINWGFKLKRVEGKDHSLHFENGGVRNLNGEEFDLIVGADGAWSKVRAVIDETKPLYSGITRYWTTIPKAETEAPEVVALINRGNLFAYGDGSAIIGQQMFDGSVDVSVGFAQEELQEVEITTTGEMLKRFEGWDERLVGIIEKAGSKVLGKSLYMLPVGYKWKHRVGITVLGDAAHLITPFGGEGVNIAFEDSVRLSDAIIKAVKGKGKEDLNRNMREFEVDMWKRAKAAATMSTNMMKAMFMTPGAPRTSVERWLLAKIKHEVPVLLYPLAVVIVYSGFFVYKLFN